MVNFGAYSGSTKADIVLKQTPGSPSLTATIINTRYMGVPGERLKTERWVGGTLRLKTDVVFEPRNGIAAIVHNVDQSNAQTTVGTPAYPALFYVTGDVVDVQGQFSVTGTVVVLGNWTNHGNPDITFDPGFIPDLPPYLEGFPFGGKSGVTELLDWREVAVGS